MYLGIDLHKQYAQVAVMDDAGEIVDEVRVQNANLEEIAQRYTGAKAVIEATSNYYHVHDTLAEYLDVTVAHPGKLSFIAQSDKKTDRVDAKELARLLRLNSVPKSYVPLMTYGKPAHECAGDRRWSKTGSNSPTRSTACSRIPASRGR